MGADWSRSKERRQVVRAFDLDDVDPLPLAPPISKAEMRAETEALVAAYRGTVKRLPTFAALRCRTCGHRGTARVPVGAAPRFKCSRCGSSLVTVTV